jgi:hypothetical protein
MLGAKVIWKVWFRISAIVLLPSELAQTVITKFKNLSNTTTLLGYMETLDIA